MLSLKYACLQGIFFHFGRSLSAGVYGVADSLLRSDFGLSVVHWTDLVDGVFWRYMRPEVAATDGELGLFGLPIGLIVVDFE